MGNKVRFNLRNVHYALPKSGASMAWDTPVPVPGAVNITLNAEGDVSPFYADGIVYYNAVANNGYSGDLELALIPDSYREDVLGEIVDEASGVMYENSFSEVKSHALLFQFDGDKKGVLHVLYNVTATRPSTEGKTTESGKTPNTEKLSFKATPLVDGLVKAKTGENTTKEVYDNWFKSVWVPSEPSAPVDL